MKRTTLILGFALLVVALTLAMTITFRNDPGRLASRPTEDVASDASRVNREYLSEGGPDSRTSRSIPLSGSADSRDVLVVTVPDESLIGLTPEEKQDLLTKADVVQREARGQLERMTVEFDLTRAQRRKMFPILARSTAQFDPAMQVGGVYLAAETRTSESEEMHALLAPEQQELLEDKELDRQLWWEDVFERIEQELFDSTGGSADQPAPAERDDGAGAESAGTERTAPTGRR